MSTFSASIEVAVELAIKFDQGVAFGYTTQGAHSQKGAAEIGGVSQARAS